PLELTEVTIPTLGDTTEDEELQADMLKLWYSLWFSHPAVENIVYWNTIDGYAYDDGKSWNENNCRGGLWHNDLTPKKSALMLKKLFNEIWHTDLELITDKDGYIDFSGFYGDYEVEVDGQKSEIGIHKEKRNDFSLKI
ncbi:MAG: glycoside hydrolase family 10, partial [Clostridia bacterium]|nr:glycoside hydrolase family 10 [Clostridia bacterium]